MNAQEAREARAKVRAKRALTEAAVIAGTACQWCGSDEDVRTRRACFCDDIHPAGFEGFTQRDGQPVCSGCWSTAEVVRVCRRCRKDRGEDASEQCRECGGWLADDGDGVKYCHQNADHDAVDRGDA